MEASVLMASQGGSYYESRGRGEDRSNTVKPEFLKIDFSYVLSCSSS